MAKYDYDLFVIGAGSGGVRASRVAAAHGAKVAIAEEHKVGGTCVIRGCVPKKLLVYGAHFAEDLADARRFGWEVPETRFNWATLRDNVLTEVERRVLTSYMNDTRWRELREAVETLSFPPVFQRQDVVGPREALWASDQMSCLGDWSHEGLEPFFMIEWIRVVPKLWAEQGQLIPMKQVGDCTVELREALDRLRLPYREDGRGFWIYGYAPGDPSTLTGPPEGAT